LEAFVILVEAALDTAIATHDKDNEEASYEAEYSKCNGRTSN
jgi:hypothetical protein